MLTIMFNCVRKNKKSVNSRRRKGELLRLFSSSYSILIPSYSNCTRRRITTYIAFPQDSSRCKECVRLNRSAYDMFNTSEAQLQMIAT